tara:strand:+ start:327 stop:503 length:177 start_codon:yes stop_codon:yes gene_type:complete
MKSKKEIKKRLKFSNATFDRLALEIEGLKNDNRSFVVESYQITKIDADRRLLEWILKE